MEADSHFSRPVRREVRTDGALSGNGVMSVDARRGSLDHEKVTTVFRTLPTVMYEPDHRFFVTFLGYSRGSFATVSSTP